MSIKNHYCENPSYIVGAANISLCGRPGVFVYGPENVKDGVALTAAPAEVTCSQCLKRLHAPNFYNRLSCWEQEDYVLDTDDLRLFLDRAGEGMYKSLRAMINGRMVKTRDMSEERKQKMWDGKTGPKHG